MADVEPEEVQWLWDKRIPLGRLTLIVGRPGEGKSFLTMELVAHVSTGRKFPDDSDCPCGSALIVSAEDDPADTIRPRLDACQADVNRVHVLTGVQYTASDGQQSDRVFTLADVPMLEAALAEHPDCKLVIIDPIGSYLGGDTDAHRDNEVRSVLAPIAELASRFNVAVVMVAHRRKSNSDFADDSALGSRAFTGIARAVWHLSRDSEDKDRRLFLPGKNNLTSEGDGLAFRIEGTPGRIVWENGPVAMTADDAQFAEARTAAQKRKSGPNPDARDAAVEWLREQLADGPKPVSTLKLAAENANHKWKTVERAKGELDIVSQRTGFGEGSQWWLPTPASELACMVIDTLHANQSPITYSELHKQLRNADVVRAARMADVVATVNSLVDAGRVRRAGEGKHIDRYFFELIVADTTTEMPSEPVTDVPRQDDSTPFPPSTKEPGNLAGMSECKNKANTTVFDPTSTIPAIPAKSSATDGNDANDEPKQSKPRRRLRSDDRPEILRDGCGA